MRARRQREGGFTYIGLLMAVVIMGLMLTVAGRVWSTTEQRERETQLLWVGHAYRLAIASYFAHGHQYPATLQQLLLDDRQPVPLHHLRKLYFDPMTGQPDWTLVMTPSGSGIMGVASSSQRTPIKRQGFDLVDDAFKDTECYCSWRFIYYPNRFGRSWGAATTTAPAAPITPNGTSNPLSPLKSLPLTPSPFSSSPQAPSRLNPSPPPPSDTVPTDPPPTP
jgi:type II secretory pathway pseudopilin PulG